MSSSTITRLPRVALMIAIVSACGSDPEDAPADSGQSSSATGAGAQGSGASGSGATGPGSGGGGNGGASTGGSGGAGLTGPQVDLSDPQLYEFELDPHVLDPTTVDSLEIQFAQLDSNTTPLGKLLVFLPGANNVPNDWKNHGRKLAEFGYHVLIPHYNNRWSTQGVCDGMGASCALDTRWEALVGEDTSSAIEISRADSAEGRVVVMLEHLTTAHPGGDWGWFLNDDGTLKYGDMVIAGISHGAASTGLYAIRRPFSRAVLHSSGPAGDTNEPKSTPIAEWYAFAHTQDPAYDPIISSWDAFGIPGAPTSIDGTSAPYGGSHRLITSENTTYPHCSVVVHDSSPITGNQYVFEPAWRYLYGVSP